MPLDALAFLNALTDDPLVSNHYSVDVNDFKSKFTSVEIKAAESVAEFRNKVLNRNLSGFLCTWFLAGHPETMEDLLELADHPDRLRNAMRQYDQSLVEINVYYHDNAWKNFQQALPDVKTLLAFLTVNGFPAYWQDTVQPRLQKDLVRIQEDVRGINIVPEIESVVGFGLPSDEVTVSLLYFVWPYGHHLIGTHFVTIPEDTGILRTTIHELLHNPFNNTDPAFWNAANTLDKVEPASSAFKNRNPSYGYNNWPDYVAEDSVRALEQVIEVKLGMGERWTWWEDGGMHQLGAYLYEQMKQEGFPVNGESYQSFIIRMVKEGKF